MKLPLLKKEKLELTEFTEEYNGLVFKLHTNIGKLNIQLKEANNIIKQLRKELSIARQEKGAGNLWAELDDGRDN